MDILTTKGLFTIREANATDLPALVRIHVISWNATYPYYQPKPSPQLREQQWKKAFAEKSGNWFCYIVEKEGGELVGFATGNDFHDVSLPYDGQLNKIHFFPQYKRLGLGRKLVSVVVKHFLEHGFRSMIIFADPGNVHTAFYEKLGGERLPDSEGKFHGAYGWMNLLELYDRCHEE